MKKLLVILPRIPFPIEKGDKLRAYYQLKQFAKTFEVHLVALNDEPVHQKAFDELKPYCESLHFFNLSKASIGFNLVKAFLIGKPFQIGYFYNKRIHNKVLKLVDEINPDHTFCQLIRSASYADKLNIPKTIDYQDVFSKGIERRIKKAPFYSKWLFKLEYQRLVEYEKYVFDTFDNKVIISEQDRDLIQHPKNQEIGIIRNGVDFNFFAPMNKAKKYDLVFTGNMGYPPNVDAVEYIVNKILPILQKSIPEITLLIAGATPHPRVLALKSDLVNVTGWLDDIRDAYSEGKIFIAPMQIGTGLQNKLLEAMSMNIPCVTSKLANNALGAINEDSVLIGETPDQYAEHILNLLNNSNLYNTIAEGGYQFVKQNYDWTAVTESLINTLDQ